MKNRFDNEDSSLQAGWMFADLLLALTVIFLATVSFIPNLVKPNESAKTSLNESVQVAQSDTLYYQIFNSEDGKLFLDDFIVFSKRRGIEFPKINQITIIAGYAVGGNSDDANIRAIKFLINAKNNPRIDISKAVTIIETSREIAEDKVAVRVNFN